MAENDDEMLPMPLGRFRLFLWGWHILYLGGLYLMLALAAVQDGPAHPRQVAILAVCVLLQTVLYAGLIIRQEEWPLGRWKALLYFGGSAALWAVQWQLDLRFLWVGWALIGQMFGVLRPWIAIPASAVLAFYFFVRARNWAIADISLGEVVGWVAMVILFLYMHGLGTASMGRSRLVAELRTAQAALQASRDKDVELAALRERERLARDLHDGLGHTLVALSVQLEATQRLYRVDPGRASAQIDAMKELVRGSMDELRRSLAGLRTAGLAGRSLVEALLALCAAFEERSGITVATTVRGDVDRLPPVVSDTLWRVIQEALTNIEKHAEAQKVEISLDASPHAVALHVSDDGIGLPGGEAGGEDGGGRTGAGGSRLGLVGMGERVEGVGGKVEISNRRPHGVRVMVEIPLHRSLTLPAPTERRT